MAVNPQDPGDAPSVLVRSPEVEAIRSGRKTMTRVPVVNPQGSPVNVHDAEWAERYANASGFTGCWSFYREMDKSNPSPGRQFACNRIAVDTLRCPYGKGGDVLKVIELRSIPNVDKVHQAGSDGNIYSYSTARTNSRKPKPFPLKQSVASTGYRNVSVVGSTTRTFAVHTLVCAAFHGPSPKPGMEVRHLDGDKFNNDPANLRWGTRAENEADKRRHRTLACGSRQGSSKLVESDVDLIRRSVSIGLVTTNRAAEFYQVDPATIRHIVAGDQWKGFGDPQPEPAPAYEHLHIEVVSVAVQRLNDISNEDALAEGSLEAVDVPYVGAMTCDDARLAFLLQWDHVYGDGAWDLNPWVWALTFRRVEG